MRSTQLLVRLLCCVERWKKFVPLLSRLLRGFSESFLRCFVRLQEKKQSEEMIQAMKAQWEAKEEKQRKKEEERRSEEETRRAKAVLDVRILLPPFVSLSGIKI